MPRRYLDRVLPKHAHLRERWYMRPFNALMHDPALWTTHRKSVVGGFALGVFVGFQPLPGHALFAIAAAIWLRVNVPVAILATWIGLPLIYVAYRIGLWLTGAPELPLNFTLSWDWFVTGLSQVWKPLVAGTLSLGTAAAAFSYIVLNVIWKQIAIARFRAHKRRVELYTAGDSPDT